MIPPFLQSLAATVRDLVRTGKAVHVTEQTAAECELLAGLPWDECSTTPADIALGWLLASKTGHDACVTDDLWERQERYKRAAECAELAMIAARTKAVYPPKERDRVSALSSAEFVRVVASGVMAHAHDGTRKGARAAWSFIAAELDRSAESVSENTRKPDRNVARYTGNLRIRADCYRRELEAM